MTDKQQIKIPPEAQDALDRVLQLGTAMLMDGGEVRPTFAFHGRDNTVRIMHRGFGDEQEKRRVFSIASMIALATDAEFLAFVTEVWIASDLKPGVQPMHSDNRREALCGLVSYFDADGARASLMRTLPIERDMATGAISLGEALDDGEGSGRLLEILPPVRPPEALREKAGALLKILGVDLDGIVLGGALHG